MSKPTINVVCQGFVTFLSSTQKERKKWGNTRKLTFKAFCSHFCWRWKLSIPESLHSPVLKTSMGTGGCGLLRSHGSAAYLAFLLAPASLRFCIFRSPQLFCFPFHSIVWTFSLLNCSLLWWEAQAGVSVFYLWGWLLKQMKTLKLDSWICLVFSRGASRLLHDKPSDCLCIQLESSSSTHRVPKWPKCLKNKEQEIKMESRRATEQTVCKWGNSIQAKTRKSATVVLSLWSRMLASW